MDRSGRERRGGGVAALGWLRSAAPVRRGRSRGWNATILAAYITALGAVIAAAAPYGMAVVFRVLNEDHAYTTSVTILRTPHRPDGGHGVHAWRAPSLSSSENERLYIDGDVAEATCVTEGTQVGQDRAPYRTMTKWIKLEGDAGFLPVVFTSLSLPRNRRKLDRLPECTSAELGWDARMPQPWGGPWHKPAAARIL